MRKSYLAILVAGLTTLGAAQLVHAQEDLIAPQVQVEQDASKVDDVALLKFSVAMDEVQKVGTKYDTKLQNVEDAAEAQKIQQDAQEEMVDAVESSGLSTEEFNQIAQLAQQDEQIRNRILSMSNSK